LSEIRLFELQHIFYHLIKRVKSVLANNRDDYHE
jgi:hypothetical protein